MLKERMLTAMAIMTLTRKSFTIILPHNFTRCANIGCVVLNLSVKIVIFPNSSQFTLQSSGTSWVKYPVHRYNMLAQLGLRTHKLDIVRFIAQTIRPPCPFL